MTSIIFSNPHILKYLKMEYNEYVKDIMINLESAMGTSDEKIEIARKFAKEKMMVEALKCKNKWYRDDLI